MSKTDRQTDRGYAWSLTIFDPGEYGILSDPSGYPVWLRKSKFQEEICPTTGRHHWQAAILTSQVRFAQVKKLFPSAHIQLARNKHALMEYVNKDDTAVEGTRKEFENPLPHMALHQQLQRMADVVVENLADYTAARDALLEAKEKSPDKGMYWWVARFMLVAEPEMAGIFANPMLEKMWANTAVVWIDAAKAASGSGCLSITQPLPVGEKIAASGIEDEEARKACTVSQEQKDG